MLFTFIQQNQPIFSFLGITLFFLLVLKILRKKRQTSFNEDEIKMLAGDNFVTTQLDLARAYLEMDKKELAKMILLQVKHQGSSAQKKEALSLLKRVK